MNGVRVRHIEQTYLLCDSGNARVRRIVEGDTVTFVKTVKQRISTLSCYEDEHGISEADYARELKDADPEKNTVIKTRYAFPFRGHTVEIDVYPFWSDRAILEVELESEEEEIPLPAEVEIIKEVSADKRYKNTELARNIPYDEI